MRKTCYQRKVNHNIWKTGSLKQNTITDVSTLKIYLR